MRNLTKPLVKHEGIVLYAPSFQGVAKFSSEVLLANLRATSILIRGAWFDLGNAKFGKVMTVHEPRVVRPGEVAQVFDAEPVAAALQKGPDFSYYSDQLIGATGHVFVAVTTAENDFVLKVEAQDVLEMFKDIPIFSPGAGMVVDASVGP